MHVQNNYKGEQKMIKMLPSKEICENLGICPNTLRKYDRDGITLRIGRCVRYDIDALMDAIKAEQEAKANE